MKISKIVRKTASVLCVLTLCAVGTISPLTVSAQSEPFEVDVWTNKGGEGLGEDGGSFAIGEELIVYIWASRDCYASITIGPADDDPSTYLDAELEGGVTVSIVPRQSAEELVGSWRVAVGTVSMVGGVLASDFVVFHVGSVVPPPAPTSPAPTLPPPTTPAVTPGTLGVATVLDALKAVKMAEGSLPVDSALDMDFDGQVTLDDARLLLQLAVQ